MYVKIANIYLVCMLADMEEGPECVAAYLSKERIAESF